MAESLHLVVRVIPSLGRSCKIGDVYDSCNDKIVSSEKLWPEIGKSIEKELIQNSSMKGCSSIDEVYESLGVDVSTRIHVELGYIDMRGLSKALFVLEEKGKKEFGMSIIHEYVTRKEFVDVAALKTFNFEHVATLQSGTHIVTGITYGCFTMFRSNERSLIDNEFTSLEDFEGLAKTFLCHGRIVSDVCKDEEDGTIEDALNRMKGVIENLQQDQDLFAFPLKFHLCPIESLAKIGAKGFEEIPASIASRVTILLSEIREVEYTLSRLQEFDGIKDIKAIRQRLTEFKNSKQEHTKENLEKLKKLIPNLHQGTSKYVELEEVLNSVESSPFSGQKAKDWIAMKEMEFEQIERILQEFDGVSVSQTARNLKKEIASMKNDLIFCLLIQIPNKDEVVEQMRRHLNDDESGDDDGDQTEGEEEKALEKEEDIQMNDELANDKFELNVKTFQTLRDRYNNDTNFKFFISYEKTDVHAMTVVINLYQDGKVVDNNFMPLCQPYELEKRELNDTSLDIKWKVQEESCQNEEYKVMVQADNSDVISYTTKETKFLIPDLKPETAYEIWVVASIAGIESEPSTILKITTLKSDVTSPPGTPLCYEYSYPLARLEWTKPERASKPISKYRVYEGNHILAQIDGQTHHLEFEIKPNRKYVFTVQADCGEYGLSKHSEQSDLFSISMSSNDIRKECIKAESTLVSKPKESPKIYLLNLIETYHDQKLSRFTFGRPVHDVPEKVVMFLGATGSGKTTLINGIINYIVGIKWEDDFRVRLIREEEGVENQAQSQTSKITAYTIHHQDGFNIQHTITLVDTPGFGDTSGIMKDREITSQIDHFFRARDGSGLDHIDGIGFVTQSSLARLTPTQRYIFDSILSLFGKDIENYIFPLLTFADGKEPQVLSSLRAANIPFQKYFKFNNSALFEDNRLESKFNKLFWEMGEASFAEFINAITKVTPMSLNLTKEVLTERETLEVQVQGIHLDVKTGLNKLEQLHTEWQYLEENENAIRRSQDFTYTVEEEKVLRVDTKVGEYTTNCITCNRTCHFPCQIPDDENKTRCAAMDYEQEVKEERCCTVCPGKCIWKVHKNLPYIFKVQRVTVKKTAQDLKKRYQTAKGEKVTREKILEGIIADIEATHMEVANKTLQVKRCVARLQEIALKPNPLSAVEYVEIMIDAERAEAQPGWHERVQQLNEVKQTAEFIDQLVNKGHNPFEDYADTVQKVKEYYKQRKEKRGPLVRFWDYIRPKTGPVEAIEYCKANFED